MAFPINLSEEYPTSAVKTVSKWTLAGWTASFALNLAVCLVCTILAIKGIGWILPLFIVVSIQLPIRSEKRRLRHAFALRHQIQAESFSANVGYSKASGLIGSDVGVAYMHNGMLCFEGIYTRFRIDRKWVRCSSKCISESCALINLMNEAQTDYLVLIIDSIREDGRGGETFSKDVERFVKPWLEEPLFEVQQPLFPPTKPIASRWHYARTIIDAVVIFLSIATISIVYLASPKLGWIDKLCAGLILAVPVAIVGLMAFWSHRAGVSLREMLETFRSCRKYRSWSDAQMVQELLREEEALSYEKA